ncbi:hypothetical protein SAMN04488012_101502 [Palleronia salina]|uniref:Uncharacterized protein n=2 Tax=Palleronia TaxID=315422 RepID=A0A1M6BIA2_9RHOB|nr:MULTISPECIES: histidinol phosphate aminotransferase [Palleronia]SEM78888.1 hypothetical protein SAMN04488011_101474 [Palleronia pelagia]SHI48213.1 hypothetical protein SAMN04488012_101502 [Palleronia salina]
MDYPRQPAPDYTRAFLVSLAPLVFIALMAIWVIWGLLAALGVTYASDKAITRLARRS